MEAFGKLTIFVDVVFGARTMRSWGPARTRVGVW